MAIFLFLFKRFKLVFCGSVCGLLLVLYLRTRNTITNAEARGIYTSASKNDTIIAKTNVKESIDVYENLKPLITDSGKIVELLHPLPIIRRNENQLPSKIDKNIIKTSVDIIAEGTQAPQPLNFNLKKGIERFLNTQDKCSPETTLLIVVCSAVQYPEKRQMIRETWGGMASTDLRIVFLVGTSPLLPAASTSSFPTIDDEAKRYRDVIRADFIDSYANLTIKSLAMLKWISTHCPTLRFLLKCDDDIVINTPLLLSVLRDKGQSRFVMGYVIERATVGRQPNTKWYMPYSMYNQSNYPSYASGAAYVISGDIISDLYYAGLNSRTARFRIKDVFITGYLAQSIGAQLINDEKFNGFKRFFDPCMIHSHIVQHKLSEEEIRFLWTVINKSPVECVNSKILNFTQTNFSDK